MFGWGVDTFGPIVSKIEIDSGVRSLLFVQSHNEFVRVCFEYGFLGLGLSLIAVVLTFKKIHFKQRIVLLSLVIGACFHNPMSHPLTLLLILSLLRLGRG